MKDKLRSAALALLKEHTTITAAAKPMAEQFVRDAVLRLLAASEILRIVAPKSARKKTAAHSRRRTGPHRRPTADRKQSASKLPTKLPTTQQKAGALQAEQNYQHAIFNHKMRGGRKLGDVRIHELRAIAQSSAETATSFLTRGYEDAVETIACTMLAGHCVAADPHAKVRETIKASVVTSIYERAQIKAAETIRDGSARLAHELLTVAAAQEITVQ